MNTIQNVYLEPSKLFFRDYRKYRTPQGTYHINIEGRVGWPGFFNNKKETILE